jgi:hypothetical protein
MANNYTKQCSVFLAIREVKIKTKVGFYLTTARMVVS